MKQWLLGFFAVALLLLLAGPALADKRIAALVIVDADVALKKPAQVATLQQPAPIVVSRQRAVLYEEDPSHSKGKQQFVGSVVWRIELVNVGSNSKRDVAIRADIDIPDHRFNLKMLLRKNTDPSLPASHIVELTFRLPRDFSDGGVANVPGLLMKTNEQARGTPLAGLAVKVTDRYFMVGLSNIDADRTRNIELMKGLNWIDLPMTYANQRRAMLAIEKGLTGNEAFTKAFSVWGQTGQLERNSPPK